MSFVILQRAFGSTTSGFGTSRTDVQFNVRDRDEGGTRNGREHDCQYQWLCVVLSWLENGGWF